ncbi:MAG: hypothetical protein L3J34_04800 [Flavobacteriaceae bacterium]|nr:hypothetical protein [Flavobacteriaceae bacterium]
MIVDSDKVKKLIPQKEPFVMVDELLTYTEEHLKSRFRVASNNIFVEDNHFVESGIIEHMAQSVALHTGYHFFLKNKPAPIGYIGSIKSVIINRLPKTGESLETKVDIIQEFMGVTLVNIEVFCKNEIIAKSQMKTVLAK